MNRGSYSVLIDAFDLADALLDLLKLRPAPGVYHAANEGHCSWHEFACEVLKAAGLGRDVGVQTAADLGLPAARPAWSVLDTSKLTEVRGKPLPSYQDALTRHLPLDEQSRADRDAGSGAPRGKQH